MSEPRITFRCTHCGATATCPRGTTEFRCTACRRTTRLAAGAVVPAPAGGPPPLPGRAMTPVQVRVTVQSAPPAVNGEDGPTAGRGLGRFLGIGLLVLVGIVLGVVTALLLSRFKQDMGPSGPVLVLLGLAVVFVGVLAVGGLMRLVHNYLPAGLQPVAGGLRRCIRGTAVIGAGCLAVCVVGVVAEAFGPPEGHVRAYLTRREAGQQAAQEQAAQESARKERAEQDKRDQDAKAALVKEDQTWTGAHFILVSPKSRAVAVRAEGDPDSPRLTVLARAAGDQTDDRLRQAWGSAVPVVGDKRPLTLSVYEGYLPGQQLKDTDAETLSRAVRSRPLVPAGAERVSFPGAGGKRRVGHLLKEDGNKWVFCDLVPRANLAARAARPGSAFEEEIMPAPAGAQRGLSRDRLRTEADYLDFAVYDMLARLEAGTARDGPLPVRPSILVAPISIESVVLPWVKDLKDRIRAVRGKGIEEQLRAIETNREAYRYEHSTGLAALMSIASDFVREARREDTARGLAAQAREDREREAKALEAEIGLIEYYQKLAHAVDDGLKKRLTDAGLPVVERPAHPDELFEVADGKVWARPAADKAVANNLVQASHLLIPQLRREGGRTGTYHLSVRLVRVQTGEITWTDDGDWAVPDGIRRPEPPKPPVSPDPGTGTLKTPMPLTGVYRHATTGMTISVSETGADVKVTLVSSTLLDRFDLYATRSGNTLTVKNCTQVFLKDRKRQHTVEARMRILNPKALEVLVRAPDPKTGRLDPTFQTVVFEKD